MGYDTFEQLYFDPYGIAEFVAIKDFCSLGLLYPIAYNSC